MKKFDWRRLFPITYYFWNKGYDFNAFRFYLDVILWSLPIALLWTMVLIKILT